ncbi:trehalose operon repressor [Streptococcus urinalis 2285-97]|uniref:Trehalose operon repressor n=2 Tax=Streptococcus urinalis TaxID=149016 RepID=G5KGT0_9STRE|nr:trehalose operon repressor [Streptococcus urinalis 2285-97]
MMKKYQHIYQQIETDILTENYKDGDFLPTEHDLSQKYKVSRDTIRKALKLLENTGLITKTQGRGSQITKNERILFPVAELTSYQELVATFSMNSKTNVIAIDKVIIDESLAKITGFRLHQIVWRVTRQRVVDGIASVLDIDYLDKELIPKMTREIAEHSIYAYLESDLGLPIDFALKEITIDHISDKDKILLDLGSENHVVSVKSKVYLSNNQQFQFTESRHKLEKFKFIDMARRHPK